MTFVTMRGVITIAYLKIKDIRVTLNKAIDYIVNEDKIQLTTFSNCIEGFANFQMMLTRKKFDKDFGNIGHHVIQSFKPGEVDPTEAHKLAQDLCKQKLNGFEYVIATHIDKDHIHNHIVLNSVNYENGKKFSNNLGRINEFREYSDYLCHQRGLSIINRDNYMGKSMSYKEWIENKHGTSWKTTVKSEIDKAVRTADSFNTFLLILREKGFEIKDKNKSGEYRKWISYKAPGMEKFVRDKSLGYQYFRNNIEARIELIKNNIDSKTIIDKKDKKFKVRKLRTNFMPMSKLEYQIMKIINQIKKTLNKIKFNKQKNNAIKYYLDNIKKLESVLAFMDDYNIHSEIEFEARLQELNFDRVALNQQIKDSKHNLTQLSDLIDLKNEEEFDALIDMGLKDDEIVNLDATYVAENTLKQDYLEQKKQIDRDIKETRHYENIVKKIIDRETER